LKNSDLTDKLCQGHHTLSLTYRGSAIDARLHTAVSVGLVYSIISVHRFDDLIVPRFCWLLFLLQASYIFKKQNKYLYARIKKIRNSHQKETWIKFKKKVIDYETTLKSM
jgi:hypothetical protein